MDFDSGKIPHILEMAAQSKVIPLGAVKPRLPTECPDPRLEELRSILAQCNPTDSPQTPCTTTYELDDQSIENEDIFYTRFGFDAPEKLRNEIIGVKRKYGFSSREIKMMRYSGQLIVSQAGVELKSKPSVAIIGGLELAYISAICLFCLFKMGHAAVPLWREAVGQLVVLFIWVGFVGLSWKLFIKPWQLVRGAIL